MRKLSNPLIAILTLGAMAAAPAAHAWGDRQQGALARAVVGALIAAQAARPPVVVAAPLPPPGVAAPLPVPIAPGMTRLPEMAPDAHFVPLAIDYPFWTERKAEMNLPESRALSWSGCSVRLPSVAAAMETDGRSGRTRT